MSKITISKNEIRFENDNGVTTGITITFNDETKVNEWNYVNLFGETSVLTRETVNELSPIITEWFETEGVEISYDFDDAMVGHQWNDQLESANKYANTPGYLPVFVPSGKIVHVGNGVWITRCNHCNHALAHYGVMQRYATTGEHEVEQHDGQVAGINVGILN